MRGMEIRAASSICNLQHAGKLIRVSFANQFQTRESEIIVLHNSGIFYCFIASNCRGKS